MEGELIVAYFICQALQTKNFASTPMFDITNDCLTNVSG